MTLESSKQQLMDWAWELTWRVAFVNIHLAHTPKCKLVKS